MDTKNHHTDQAEYENTDAVNFSPNGLKQTFDKNENDEILILEEKLYFGPGSEQVKIPLEVLGIDELEAIGSFSVTMNVKLSSNVKEIKNDQIFFQIGSSVMNKTLVLGITRDRTFFASCLTQKNKLETCYTQCKVKNAEYHVGVSVIDEGNFSEITIYVNGQNEASLVFPSSIDALQGYFVWGSDSPVDGFQGEISEAMFYVKTMEPHDMKECFASKRNSPKDKSLYLVRKEKKDFLNATDYYSKKKGLPVNLVRTHAHGIEKNVLPPAPGEKEEHKKAEENISEDAKRKQQLYAMVDGLKDLIYQDENLYFHARDLGFNFEWVFKVCSVLSPVIEDRGSQPKHSFNCLHNSICEGEARYYPCYPITVEQFMKVIAKLDTKLSSDEVIKMAERIDCLDMNKEFGNFIYYDRFLLAVRNATFSREEIKYINKARNDDVEKQVIRTEKPEAAAPGQPQTTTVINAYNLIPIFENADYFDQRDFIEAHPDAVLIKIILSIHKPTNHVKYIHFSYKLKDGKIHDFEVGKPIVSGLENMVHFTIDINDNEFITGVKASNYHANNANKLISYLSFCLNTHPDGIAYGQFTGHPGELKSIQFDPSEYGDKKVLGFYGAFRDDLIGFGVYVKEKVVVKPPPSATPEEAQKNQETAVTGVADEEEAEEYVLTLPQVKQEWNEGRIQVIMNRCADCNKHKTTTSHHEADFCMKFNEWGNRIKDYFPNAEIVGNYDKPKCFGIFEIYIRGVGPNHERDNEGRIFLHQNYTTPEMKTSFAKLLETLIMYCFEYGDSVEMAKAQGTFLKKHAHEIPKKWTGCHDHPVDVPERSTMSQTKRGQKGKLEDGTQVVCQNWACGEKYTYDSMNETICQHHPGRYEFGSVHGLWPEGWTCCRGAWEDRGCKKGKHTPIPASRFYQLCINHGAMNPKTERPDSACGKSYQDSSDECKYHSGYMVGRGANAKWTCCSEMGETAAPCETNTHKSAEWPDEEAKLYFITRDVRNPGIYRNDNSGPGSFASKITTSGFYKKTKPYTIYENPQRKRAKEMEETENEPRVCMNWGCGQQYKEADNKKVRHCKSHPGVWDFGYTGITVSQAISEFNRDSSEVLLWKPHWTCCRQHWAAKGCTKTFHKGPLASEAIEPKYKWPSEDAQKFFRKTVSPLWKAKLENQYMLEPAQVAQKFDDYAKSMGGKINMGMLPQLCDKLKLHLLIISEDLSNHIRFLQVINHTADPVLDDGQGNIDKKKFIDWWYAKLDE